MQQSRGRLTLATREGAAQHHPLGLGQPILDIKRVAVTVMPRC